MQAVTQSHVPKAPSMFACPRNISGNTHNAHLESTKQKPNLSSDCPHTIKKGLYSTLTPLKPPNAPINKRKPNTRLDLAERPPPRQQIPLATALALFRRPHQQRTRYLRRCHRDQKPADSEAGLENQLDALGGPGRGSRYPVPVGAARDGEIRLSAEEIYDP